jgi:hypothetical protein
MTAIMPIYSHKNKQAVSMKIVTTFGCTVYLVGEILFYVTSLPTTQSGAEYNFNVDL